MSRKKSPALLFLAVLMAIPAWSQSKSPAKTEKIGTAKVAGMQVAIDPHTGRLRQPTPEERQALARALGRTLNRSTEGLRTIVHPNGMKSVDLQGRFQSTSVATIDSTGKVKYRCLTNPAEAKAFLKTSAAPTAKEAK